MALTPVQKEQLKKAVFYAQQDPSKFVDLFEAVLDSVSGGGIGSLEEYLKKTEADTTYAKKSELKQAKEDALTLTNAEDGATLKTGLNAVETKVNSIITKLETAGILSNQ